MNDKTKIEEGHETAEVKYVRKTNREIRELAIALRSGQAFGSWMMDDPSLLQTVFMPLAFMNTIMVKTLQRDGIVHFYGQMKDAAPRSINGMPMFFSMHLLNQEDSDRLNVALKQLNEFMEDDEEIN